MALQVLSIDLEARLSKFTAHMGQAARLSEQTSTKISNSLGAIKTAVGGIAAGLSVGFFAGQVKDVAAYADEIGKMSQRVGVTTEALSGLAYAAGLSDVSNEQLAGGLQRLSKLMQEASGGMEQQKRVLKELGVTELRDVNKAFLQLATRFSEMKEGAGKTTALMAAFGKSGADLAPLLNTGADGIRAATNEAARFGLIIDKDAKVAAERFNDSLTRLAALSQGAGISLYSDLVKNLGLTAEAYLEATKAGTKFEGFLASVQTLFTGDDQHKNNVALVEQTEELLKLEGDISKLRSSGSALDAAQARKKEERLKALREEIKTTMTYRAQLESIASTPIATGDVDSSIFGKAGPRTRKTKEPKSEPIDNTQRALDQYIESLQSAIVKSQDLSEVQIAQFRIAETGARGFSEFKREYVLGLAEQVDALKSTAEMEQFVASARVANNAITARYLDGLSADNDALIRNNETLRQQLEELGLTAGALGRLRLARLDSALATERQNLVNAQNIEGNKAEVELIEKRIRLKLIERGLVSDTVDTQGKLSIAAETQQAAKLLNSDVKNALSNAFRDSKDPINAFGDALGNVVYTRLTNATASVLANYLVGSGKPDGEGGILSGLFSLLPSFAVGTDSVPHDMVAKIHKGERIVPAAQNRRGYSGGSDGGGASGSVVVHITQNVGDLATVSMLRRNNVQLVQQIKAGMRRSSEYGGELAS